MSSDTSVLIQRLLASDSFIPANKTLLHIIGCAATILLQYLISQDKYLTASGKISHGDWFFKTQANIQQFTSIKPDSQRTIIKDLVEYQFIETKLMGQPATKHFKINYEAINAAISEYQDDGGQILPTAISRTGSEPDDNKSKGIRVEDCSKEQGTDADASEPLGLKRNDAKAGYRYKDSRFIEKWNSHPEFRQHNNHRTRVYQNGHRFCLYLKNGSLSRCDIDKQFLARQKIPLDALTRKWTDEEIYEAFDRFALMHKEGYWPRDKKNLPKNLCDFICNVMSGSSYFLWVMYDPPHFLADKYAAVKDHNPAVSSIYRSMLEKFYNKKISSQRDVNKLHHASNAICLRYKDLQPVIAVGNASVRAHFGSVTKFAGLHADWMKSKYGDKIMVTDITRSWNYFIEYVRKTHKIDLEPGPQELSRMQEDHARRQARFVAEYGSDSQRVMAH